jgi:LysM repeat protein
MNVTGRIAAAVLTAATLDGCDEMTTKRDKQVLKDADAKAAEGDFLRAINLYEQALDGSPASADIHYRLAILYDDKMNEPLNALHHFKRYLTLAPNGSHTSDVKNLMKRDELAIATTMSGDSVVSRAEAARLRNDNLELRKQVQDQLAKAQTVAHANDKAAETRVEKASAAKKPSGGGRTYVVQQGDTLASISRKFYKSSDRWKKILEANHGTLSSPAELKPGQTLTIP